MFQTEKTFTADISRCACSLRLLAAALLCLYYQGQPDFDLLVARIHQHINSM